jgi:hypothetical protein
MIQIKLEKMLDPFACRFYELKYWKERGDAADHHTDAVNEYGAATHESVQVPLSDTPVCNKYLYQSVLINVILSM